MLTKAFGKYTWISEGSDTRVILLFPTNRFMRKGQVGSHREELEPEYITRLTAYIEKGLKGSAFQFME